MLHFPGVVLVIPNVSVKCAIGLRLHGLYRGDLLLSLFQLYAVLPRRSFELPFLRLQSYSFGLHTFSLELDIRHKVMKIC